MTTCQRSFAPRAPSGPNLGKFAVHDSRKLAQAERVARVKELRVRQTNSDSECMSLPFICLFSTRTCNRVTRQQVPRQRRISAPHTSITGSRQCLILADSHQEFASPFDVRCRCGTHLITSIRSSEQSIFKARQFRLQFLTSSSIELELDNRHPTSPAVPPFALGNAGNEETISKCWTNGALSIRCSDVPLVASQSCQLRYEMKGRLSITVDAQA